MTRDVLLTPQIRSIAAQWDLWLASALDDCDANEFDNDRQYASKVSAKYAEFLEQEFVSLSRDESLDLTRLMLGWCLLSQERYRRHQIVPILQSFSGYLRDEAARREAVEDTTKRPLSSEEREAMLDGLVAPLPATPRCIKGESACISPEKCMLDRECYASMDASPAESAIRPIYTGPDKAFAAWHNPPIPEASDGADSSVDDYGPEPKDKSGITTEQFLDACKAVADSYSTGTSSASSLETIVASLRRDIGRAKNVVSRNYPVLPKRMDKMTESEAAIALTACHMSADLTYLKQAVLPRMASDIEALRTHIEMKKIVDDAS